MATHDYIIDNGTGSAVRTDLNNALAAIVSNNSSSSEPSTKYAYQWWADTNTGILKIRNSANNAWVELLQLDGTLTLEDGSVSTPALAFRDDLNTGIYSSAADTFNVATGGVERMELGAATIFNEDGADVDFRIEGDTQANLFYVDAGNDKIGMGTSSPDYMLHIEHTTNALFSKGSQTTAISLTFGASSSHILRCENGEFAFGLSNASPFPLYIQGRNNSNAAKDITVQPIGGSIFIRNTDNPLPSNSTGIINLTVPSGADGVNIKHEHTGNCINLWRNNTDGTLINFYRGEGSTQTNVGNINVNSSATAYNTSSDYRLKENATAISDGITRLKTLKPYRFNFKVDASTKVDGFFAHEVTAVPEAITGTKDEVVTQAMIDAGNYQETALNDPIYQGIDQSKLVPLLVAAVQELITKVETLEAA